MAKITTIIDIGSNSMRMVVLEKTSRFAFNLINETRSRVKISEGCYENGGNLQEAPMQRAFNSLESFLNISKALKSRKIICVATSALRDAPNSNLFLNRVRNELGLNIKVIDGKKEAYYGGIAALNLVYSDRFVTVDIGGGSTEFAFIKDKKIEKCISLDIGTVRLSELFFNKNDYVGAKNHILEKLQEVLDCGHEIPQTVVGIGGTIRALSKVIMIKNNYPLDILHGYSYSVDLNKYICDEIINAKDCEILKTLGVKKDRFDTIKEGTFIFKTILEELQIKRVITSGAGVREGVYLNDLLRNSNYIFPVNFNVSVRNLLDRFQIDERQSAYFGRNAGAIFDALQELHNLPPKYRVLLIIASKLHSIGNALNFYKSNDNTFDFILHGLNYDFLHSSRVVVAHTIKFSKKALPKRKDLKDYEQLLPELDVMQWLSFMISLNLTINQDLSNPKVEYKLVGNELNLFFEKEIFMVKNEVDKLETPKDLKVCIYS
ncbi:Ppx/GppA phosphatase family protein [Halarcobacter ebronensis]|uniref:Guanosine polyphosphate pyrophosphohydrolase n=2 Tax=Halarcobacter ebronensis TaxID=1462615 RepID=A0A4Q1AZ36_9BACT|nr:Ppx/GppA phosphatase family protein [Halarcobacter ebronensis]QKF82569.1 guanosine-5'-triphosphate, 3'-diphosphate pyrophosphatase [Halarcobacter ebronensis]RXK07418.1 guanosine polyphosphate pyrophosphohydrolase [Halarcobacter ebronensis]